MYLYDDGDTTCGRQSEVSMRVINQSEGEHNVVNKVNGNKDIFEKNIFIAFP